MYTKPNTEALLEGAMLTLSEQIAPHLADVEKVKLEMVLVLLQNARQIVQVEQQAMVAEHNAMIDLYVDLCQMLPRVNHPEAGRLCASLTEFAARRKIPELPARSDIFGAHADLSRRLKGVLEVLHALLAEGRDEAAPLLGRVRAHLADRMSQEFSIYADNPGSMPGRN
jgi:hypothetical protein